jgi:cell division septation protein DedD
MTDRHSGYIVTLDADIREDDAEAIITALRMVKHVASVTPVVAQLEDHMARQRVRYEARSRLFDAIDQAFDA